MAMARRLRDGTLDLVRNTFVTRVARKLAPRSFGRLKDYYRIKSEFERGGVLVDELELEREYVSAVRWLKDRLPAHEIGDYLEFGVYYGTSLACMHRVLDAEALSAPRLFGFDSFEGLPPSDHPDDRSWRPGQFRSSYAFAREYLSRKGVDWNRVTLIEGWFDETLTPSSAAAHGIRKAGIVMVDCDMYVSARAALGFCAPLVKDHAVFFFDDWNSGRLAEQGKGEKRAFEEFMSQNPHLSVQEFGRYACKGEENGRVFLVSIRSEP